MQGVQRGAVWPVQIEQGGDNHFEGIFQSQEEGEEVRRMDKDAKLMVELSITKKWAYLQLEL